MSLNRQQREQTSSELRANLRLTGLTEEEVASDLDLGHADVERALDLTPDSRPELVWLVRDHLESVVKANGDEPQPYTVLTEDMRASASRWFPPQ